MPVRAGKNVIEFTYRPSVFWGLPDLEPCDVPAIGGPRAGARGASILSAHSYQSRAGSWTYTFAFSRTIITKEYV